jgi:hypothetical protein
MTYRFTRLPFGLTCSPFLLSAAVREHADMNIVTFPTAAALIDSNSFMDDFAAGGENENDAITIYCEPTALMKLINFLFAKWASNSGQLKAIWRAEGRDIVVQTQVLGVNWNTETDCFFLDPEVISGGLPEEHTTKRRLLQTTAIFEDPLGLYSPVSVVGNCYFRTPGPGDLIGMNYCLLILVRVGTIG